MQRRLLIIGGIALVILLGIGLYLRLAPRGSGASGQGTTNNFFSAFFPFGAPQANTGTSGPASGQDNGTNAPQAVTERLRKVADAPAVGGWFVSTATTTAATSSTQAASLSIRYVDRATGHVFETPVDEYTETRASVTTVTGMEALVPVNASSFIFRTLLDDDTAADFLAIVASSSDATLADIPLPAYSRISVSPDGSQMLTVTENGSGSSVSLSKPDGSGSKTFFSSPIRSWVPLASDSTLFLETAPSSGIPGYLYTIQSNGSLSRVVGDVPGLMALPSPSGRYVLYSAGSGDTLALALFDTKTGTTYQAPIAALATKCAWVTEDSPTVFCGVSAKAANASLPDDWLLGTVALDDSAWIIKPVLGTAHALGRLGDLAGSPVDVAAPSVSPDGRYALFTNKNDLTLWSLDLTRDK